MWYIEQIELINTTISDILKVVHNLRKDGIVMFLDLKQKPNHCQMNFSVRIHTSNKAQ